MAAEAIVWASQNKRRELNVGSPTAAAILVGKFFPGLADRFLAATGYESQQMDEPVEPDHPGNLFQPVPEDRGARGPFTDQERQRSRQLWATTRLGLSPVVDFAAGIVSALSTLAGAVRK